MRKYHLPLWAALLFVLTVAQNALAHPLDKVYGARSNGQIDLDTFYRYLILGLHAPVQLPAEFQDTRPTRMVTMAKADLNRNYDRLSEANKSLLRSFGVTGRAASATAAFTGVGNLTETTDVTVGGTTYRIHYTTNTGNLDVTTPAFVNGVAAALTTTVNFQKNTLGYPMPYRDQQDGVYDVYLSGRECGDQSTYGYVSAQGTLGDNPNSTATETDSLPSFLVLDNDYAEFQGDPTQNMQITVSHEHFHSVQFGVSYFNTATDTSGVEGSWLAESTATWMETQVYDVSGTYTEYMDSIFLDPELGLFNYDNNNLRQYGHFMLHKYMEENGTVGTSQAEGRAAIQNTYFTARTTANQTGKSITQIYREQVQTATRFTTWLDLVKEFSIAVLLRTADLSGSDAYQFSKASTLQTSTKGNGTITPPFVNTSQTFTSTTLTHNGTGLRPLGYQYLKLVVNAPAQVTVDNVTGAALSLRGVTFAAGAGTDLTATSARTAVNATISPEVAATSTASATFNLSVGTHILRVLNTTINPGSTTAATYRVTVAAAPQVNINCNLTADSAATHPHVGDAALLLDIVLGTNASTACAGGACDYDKSGNATPDAADVTALAGIVTGGDTASVCNSVFGQ